MRSIALVFAIVVLALGVSFLFTARKDLNPSPMISEADRKDREQAVSAKKSDLIMKQKRVAQQASKLEAPKDGSIALTLTIEGRGDIALELYPKAAPKTVGQFMQLVRSGFYRGIKYHRVEPGFVVQAGDPKTRDIESPRLAAMDAADPEFLTLGIGGSGKPLEFEPSGLPCLKGTLAMALTSPQSDTADSQFFINLNDNRNLDGDYCVFGVVTSGMDVAARIRRGDAIANLAAR